MDFTLFYETRVFAILFVTIIFLKKKSKFPTPLIFCRKFPWIWVQIMQIIVILWIFCHVILLKFYKITTPTHQLSKGCISHPLPQPLLYESPFALYMYSIRTMKNWETWVKLEILWPNCNHIPFLPTESELTEFPKTFGRVVVYTTTIVHKSGKLSTYITVS